MALVWTDADGDRCIQPLPVFKGVEPPHRHLLEVPQAFPGLRIGPEPPCDRSARHRAPAQATRDREAGPPATTSR